MIRRGVSTFEMHDANDLALEKRASPGSGYDLCGGELARHEDGGVDLRQGRRITARF
jgi:hypothetical protein